MAVEKIVFLPGASGNRDFWKPLGELLGGGDYPGWPGFGSLPPNPHIKNLEDLAATVTSRITEPTAIIAQSMGGVIALMAALEKPDLISRLVLSVTSGGISFEGTSGEDWRTEFRKNYPNVPNWFEKYRVDLSTKIKTIKTPSLLLFGDSDPICPVKAGERLAELLPHSRLEIIKGGRHDLGNAFAKEIHPMVRDFLANGLIYPGKDSSVSMDS